ncbi:MAG: replication-relaxation family protein, partial [Haloechinothrix sp.]
MRGGTSQTRYALGYQGARLIAAQRAQRPPAPKAYTESLERLGLWPKLAHQLGVNDFFCALAAHRNPARLRAAGREGEASGLTQWWSEKRCTGFFWKHQSGRETRLRPDGYGCWEEHGRVVRFFLKHDTGTEPLTKVTGKLADYRNFETDAFGVLLFSVHSTRREIALRTVLRRDLAGHDAGVVIATTARGPHDSFGHADGPAGRSGVCGRSTAATACRVGTAEPDDVVERGVGGRPATLAETEHHRAAGAELGRAAGLEPLAWQVGSSGGLVGCVLRGDRRAVFAHWIAVLRETYDDAVVVRPERLSPAGARSLR